MALTHTDDRKPFWTVTTVFDPDGLGGDFAYTSGLHERGVPELWVAGRPSLGDDPGHDWKLSNRDLGRLLNKLSWLWLDSRLSVGDRFEREYDAGGVTVRFRVDPPDDPEGLEAFQIAPDAQVVPVRWSLHRPPIAEPRPMALAAEAAAEREYVRLLAGLPSLDGAPAGWELPETPEWSIDGRFGPRTALVLLRAAHLWVGHPDSTLDLYWVLRDLAEHHYLGWPTAVVRTAARPVGRSAHLEALEQQLPVLVDHLLGRLVPVLTRAGYEVTSRDRQNLEYAVSDLLLAALATEAVADVVPDDVRMYGLGPLTAARLPVGEPPGPEWLAGDDVRDAVTDLVRQLGPRGVVAVSNIHESADDDRYLSVASQLRCFTYTTASCWQPRDEEELGAGFWREVLAIRAAEGHNRHLVFHEWASIIAAMLTHRMAFSAEEVDVLAAPYRSFLPPLPEVLNSPV